MKPKRTLVGEVDADVLAFSVGRDPELDRVLVEADCLGTAAHVFTLSRLRLKPPILTATDAARVRAELCRIVAAARRGAFRITTTDQDVHLAIERHLTRALGELGKRVHTGRSRNDQIAVDLRLYAKNELLDLSDEIVNLADALLDVARRHVQVPMVGRTHMQPAMPSSVGLWAASHAEGLLDDHDGVRAAWAFNDRCPLGSAAGYGTTLPLNRARTARLLGFREPMANVLYASSARGKCESVILQACAQVMLSLSRLAEDLILYSLPEFGYFRLPRSCTTGSSIMPHKNNPDPLELVRAKAVRVIAAAAEAATIVCRLPSGYHRDLQEIKGLFLEGLETTRRSTQILARLVRGLAIDGERLRAAFRPEVFAADRALHAARAGIPFRDAYRHVKAQPETWRLENPDRVIQDRAELRNPGIRKLTRRAANVKQWVRVRRRQQEAVRRRLLGR